MAEVINPEVKSEADPKQPAAGTDGKDETIPKERFDQIYRKHKAAEDELVKARTEIEALKKQQEAAKAQDNKPKGETSVEALAAQIRDIQQQGVLAALLKHPEIATEEQALKVREVLNQYPDFTPKDALAVARARNIELFQGKDPRGFQPGIHGSVRPNGSGAPTPETLKQQVGAIKSMTNPIDRDAAERRLHGKMVLDRLAASMGLKAKPE